MSPRRIGEVVERSLEKDSRAWLAIFSLACLLITAGRALRPFWYDELFTFYISRLPNLRSVFAALREGLDWHPPLLFLLTRGSHAIFGEGEFVTRLPQILAFWGMCLCLYAFIARRCPKPYAFTAMLVPFLTPAYRYAAEARPYALEFFGLALALLAWQRATDGSRPRWALPLLYAALCFTLLTHCLAPVFIAPIVVGQLLRDFGRRRPDWPVWICLAGAAPMMLFYLPALASTQDAFKGHHPLFAPELMSLPRFYAALGGTLIWPLAAALFLLPRRAREPGSRPLIPLHEIVCATGVTLSPLLVLALAFGVTGIFEDRYGLASMVGVSLLVPMLFRSRGEDSPAHAGLLAAVFALAIALSATGGSVSALASASTSVPPPSLAATPPGLPIVYSNGLMFLEADHYQPAAVAARSYFLCDPAAGLRYNQFQVLDKTFPLMRRWMPIRGTVEPYADFMKRHSEMIVYGTYDHPTDWLVRRLKDEGYRLTYLGNHMGSYGPVLLMRAERR